MSGGLLEKAKQASDDDDEDVDAAADAVIETEWTGAEASGSSVMLYIASGSLVICMGLLYFMYLLPVYSLKLFLELYDWIGRQISGDLTAPHLTSTELGRSSPDIVTEINFHM